MFILLTPSYVLEDQTKLKEKINNEKNLALLGQNLQHIKSRCEKFEKEEKKEKGMEKKIMYSSLIKTCDELLEKV